MPQRLTTRYRYPGCPRTVRGPFCDEHRGTYARRSDERRGTPTQRGYDATWANVANLRRQRDAYLCQVCLKRDYLMPSKIVDHIIPVHVRPDWRLVLGNTQVICPPCHQPISTSACGNKLLAQPEWPETQKEEHDNNSRVF